MLISGNKTKGWIIAAGDNGELVFRIYNKEKKGDFIDYEILALDFEIELQDLDIALNPKTKTLDYRCNQEPYRNWKIVY